MKYLCILLLSFFSLAVLSQTEPTGKIKMAKARFTKAKTLRELIPSLPKECPVSEYHFAIDTPELTKTITIKNNKITSDLKSIVKGMKAGQKFFIENIKSNCKTAFKTKYTFVIT